MMAAFLGQSDGGNPRRQSSRSRSCKPSLSVVTCTASESAHMPGSGCRFIHGRGAEAKRNWGPGRSPAPALQLDLFCSGSGHRGACAQLYTRAAGGRASRRHGDGGQLFLTRGERQAKAHRRHRDLCRRHGVGVPCHLRGCAARCRRPSSRASTPRVPEPEPSASCAASFSPPTQRCSACRRAIRPSLPQAQTPASVQVQRVDHRPPRGFMRAESVRGPGHREP